MLKEMFSHTEAILCYLEGLEKINQIKSAPNAIMKDVEISL
jgi:hypothetical protein